MLLIKNAKNNVKYHYIALHYNEIFLNDTIKELNKRGLNLLDMIPYNVNENYDFFMFKYTGDIETLDTRLYYEITCTYSKVKFSDLIRKYAEHLKKVGFDLTITENVFFKGGLNG